MRKCSGNPRQEIWPAVIKCLGICSCFVLVLDTPKIGSGKEAATWIENH